MRLAAVADCRLLSPAGLERDLDAFYGKLLRFERDEEPEGIVYRAENFRLVLIWLKCLPGGRIFERLG